MVIFDIIIMFILIVFLILGVSTKDKPESIAYFVGCGLCVFYLISLIA